MQTILIHHGTSPLGQHIARMFSQQGVQVIVLDCHDDQGYALVAQNPQIRYWSYRVNQSHAFAQVSQDLLFQFGQLNGLLLLPPQNIANQRLQQAQSVDLLQQLTHFVLQPFELIQTLRPLLYQSQAQTVLLFPQPSHSLEQALIQPCLGALANFSHCFQCDEKPLSVNTIAIPQLEIVTKSCRALGDLDTILQALFTAPHQLQGQHFNLRHSPSAAN